MNRRLFSLVLLVLLFGTSTALAVGINKTELVRMANKELKEAKIFQDDYFRDSNSVGKVLSTSPYLVGERNLIVYGEPYRGPGDPQEGRYRYLGYTMNNSPFTNYLYPNDVTSNIGLWDRNWVEDPRENPITRMRSEVQSTGIFNNNPSYEESIRLGLKLISRKNPDGSLMDFPEDRLRAKQWHRYVHVYQPPTSVSWGAGIMFHNPEGNTIRYLTVPMSPEGIVPPNDLIAQFEAIPTTAPVGQAVIVSAKVKSTFKEAVNTQYSWEVINNSTGQVVDNIVYEGHGFIDPTTNTQAASGPISIPATGERLFYATFPMPDTDVSITFRINNSSGTEPEETNLENNILSSTIYKGTEYNLPYHVLSRQIKHPLIKGADIEAQLYLSRGSWTGNATGNLDVAKSSQSEVLSNYQVLNNPGVDEPNAHIIRNPVASATITRTSVGDNPLGRNWLNPTNPALPITRAPSLDFDGSVSRLYQYYHTDYDCKGHEATAYANFESGTDILGVEVYSYNGKRPGSMPSVSAREFKKVVEQNPYNQLARELFWTSVPYNLDVIRWMHHLDENGNEYGAQKVDGQYKRRFTQQDSAEITFTSERPMSLLYKSDRDSARAARNGKNYYPRVPFATDKDLQRFEYPFKSGYYFNPAGQYKFIVKTELYKNNNNDTQEHREIVNKIIGAFRYESNLEYTEDGRTGFNLSFTEANTRGTGMLEVEKDHDKTFYELPHSTHPDRETHRFFKEILEGYPESNTQRSKDQYKYREYIKGGQRIYKVVEETEVTITVNPDNKPMYTMATMQDGEYYLRAWLQDFTLTTNDSNGLVVKGRNRATPLDEITVTVKGSMFDDLNN